MGVQLIFGYACDHLLPSAYNRTFGFFEGISVSVSEKKRTIHFDRTWKKIFGKSKPWCEMDQSFSFQHFLLRQGLFFLEESCSLRAVPPSN